jgi:hypothetical protein
MQQKSLWTFPEIPLRIYKSQEIQIDMECFQGKTGFLSPAENLKTPSSTNRRSTNRDKTSACLVAGTCGITRND